MSSEIVENALSESVKSLPASWYYDINFYQKELNSIWYRNWIYVCHSSALESQRSFYTIKIGSQSVIVVRDRNNKLRAYYNTCRHRGSAICDKNKGILKTPVLLCPYHQWSYAMEDGRLVKTSSFKNSDNFKKEDYGLFKVKLQEWRGCIFINLNEEAEWDVENLFHRSASELERFPIEDMKIGYHWTKIIKCNWKSFWENFNECLHCPNVHPELSKLVPLYSKRIISPKDLPNWLETHDIKTFRKIDIRNPARVLRAIEVLKQTGIGLSEWHKKKSKPLVEFREENSFVINIEISELNERISNRFHNMINNGALDEVTSNKSEWSKTLPGFQAIGAQQLFQYINNEITFDEATEQSIIRTRQYAKRQRTWFRNKMSDWTKIVN